MHFEYTCICSGSKVKVKKKKNIYIYISIFFLRLTPFDPNRMYFYINLLKYVIFFKGTHEGQNMFSMLSGFLVT